MSRVGKKEIQIPAGVTASVAGSKVEVKGPLGNLSKEFDPIINITVDNNTIAFQPKDSSRFANAMHGTTRSIVNAMVEGVSKGFTKDLEITGVGFGAKIDGARVVFSLGHSHPDVVEVPSIVKVKITDGTKINLSSIDKQQVGEVAAKIESFYKMEPYKGKGVKIVGKFYRRKESKKTA